MGAPIEYNTGVKVMSIPTVAIVGGIAVVGIWYLQTQDDSHIVQGIPIIAVLLAYVLLSVIKEDLLAYFVWLLASVCTLVIGIIGKRKKWNVKMSELELFAGLILTAICLLPVFLLLFAYMFVGA